MRSQSGLNSKRCPEAKRKHDWGFLVVGDDVGIPESSSNGRNECISARMSGEMSSQATRQPGEEFNTAAPTAPWLQSTARFCRVAQLPGLCTQTIEGYKSPADFPSGQCSTQSVRDTRE